MIRATRFFYFILVSCKRFTLHYVVPELFSIMADFVIDNLAYILERMKDLTFLQRGSSSIIAIVRIHTGELP